MTRSERPDEFPLLCKYEAKYVTCQYVQQSHAFRSTCADITGNIFPRLLQQILRVRVRVCVRFVA